MAGDDMTLVREYSETRSESAFAELVQRHIGLVHSAALRKTGEPHLAQEITQTVFIVLARKAATLSAKTILPVWLHRTTLYVAADVLKNQRRRQFREQKAFMQSQLSGPSGHDETASAWSQLAPMLDDALGELAESDRAALVLRYFQDKPARDIAAALHIGEEAAQKRVTRALDKLRTIFARRGVTLSTAALGSAIAANSVSAVPAGMAATISTVAVAATTTGSILTTTTAIAMTTLQKTVVASLLVTTVGVGVFEAKQAATARSEARALQEQQAPLADQILQLQKERDDATNRLAALTTDAADANANSADLLRLRGELAGLRNQFAAHTNNGPSDTHSLELQDVDLAAVLRLYGQWSRKTLLLWPTLPNARFSIKLSTTNQTEATKSLEIALAAHEIASIPDGSKFIMVVPKVVQAQAHPHSSELPPSETTESEDMISVGTINFSGADLQQFLAIYADLLGKQLDQTELPLPRGPVLLKAETALSRAECLYAFETILSWHNLKVVPAEAGLVKAVQLSQSN